MPLITAVYNEFERGPMLRRCNVVISGADCRLYIKLDRFGTEGDSSGLNVRLTPMLD